MGICISTAKQCISTGEEVVDDFINRQSRFYKESELAKEHLSQKKQTGNDSHINNVLKSDISPIYPSLPKGAKKYHCRSVYDGDTITLEDNSKTGIKIRLLGIDTPEITEKQPFSQEAKEYTKKYCHNKDVWISLEHSDDENEKNKDRYGRLLAFVWVPLNSSNNNKRQSSKDIPEQWLCINEGLVGCGLAHVYSPSKSKVHNNDKLIQLQKLARKHKRGQWKTYKDYHAIVTPSGSAFHKCIKKKSMKTDCKYLARSKNLSLILASQAYEKGMHPCRNCFE